MLNVIQNIHEDMTASILINSLKAASDSVRSGHTVVLVHANCHPKEAKLKLPDSWALQEHKDPHQ